MGNSRAAMRFVDLDTVALLELVRSDDTDAFGELFVRYEAFARKVARRASRRHADDLVSESFRRILTAISRGAGPTQAFGPYLAATIRSAAAGLAVPYHEVELDVSQLVGEETGDVDPRVSTAFVALPEAWQNALWYSDVEGMSPRHAAPLLGLPTANAFSALRQRARAGLRSAYLTEVVDDACNDEVREHLQLMIDGKTTPEALDQMVDEHIEHCDECAAIAWRVAAVSGSKLGLVLAPAMLAFHGFGASSSLLPAGLGLTGIWGWFRRLPSQAAAGVAVAVIAAGIVAAAAGVYAVGGGDGEASTAPATPTTVERVASAGPVASPASTAAAPPPATTVPPVDTTSTTSTTTTTSTVPPTTLPLVLVTAAPSVAADTTTTAPAVTTTRPTTSTVPAVTTAPATTVRPATTSTVAPTTTTTLAPTTTTSTTTTSTTTTSTTTSTTTVPEQPGSLSILSDTVSGSGLGSQRWIEIQVGDLTGAPGSLSFSSDAWILNSTNIDCSFSGCTFSGTTAPDVATVRIRVFPGPFTIVLRDADGVVIDSYSSPV